MHSNKNGVQFENSIPAWTAINIFRIILRNYIAQSAIEAAEKGDFSEVQRVMAMLERPYAEAVPDVASLDDSARASFSASSERSHDEGETLQLSAGRAGSRWSGCGDKPPKWSAELKVSWSS